MSDEVEARPCKACGMPIEFRRGPSGDLIPLQRVKTVYTLGLPLGGAKLVGHNADSLIEAYFVSHFETCPNASQFSKKGKR